MSKPRARTIVPPTPMPLLGCGLAGWALGRIVAALAARHEGSTGGLIVALVVLGSAAAGLTCWLLHRHQQRHGPDAAAPVRAWWLALGAGLIGALQFGVAG